jgi:carbon monoxide dehydrogenase subunit G
MVTLTNSIAIDRPVEDVFAYVADVAKDPTWHTDVIEGTKVSQGPIGIGAKLQIRIKPFMGMSEGVEEVVGFEPNRTYQVRAQMGPMRSTLTCRLEPLDGGTRFTRRVEIQTSGLMGLMMTLMRPMMARRNAEFVANLKRVLERGSSPT